MKMMIGIGIAAAIILVVGVIFFTTQKAEPSTEVEGCGPGTVLSDNEILCWQKSDSPNTVDSWQEAKDYCESLTLGDKENWRLPTKSELEGIVVYTASPSIDSSLFTDTETRQYWTSTPYAPKAGFYWYVHFNNGFSNFAPEAIDDYGVRCVRDVRTIL